MEPVCHLESPLGSLNPLSFECAQAGRHSCRFDGRRRRLQSSSSQPGLLAGLPASCHPAKVFCSCPLLPFGWGSSWSVLSPTPCGLGIHMWRVADFAADFYLSFHFDTRLHMNHQRIVGLLWSRHLESSLWALFRHGFWLGHWCECQHTGWPSSSLFHRAWWLHKLRATWVSLITSLSGLKWQIIDCKSWKDLSLEMSRFWLLLAINKSYL